MHSKRIAPMVFLVTSILVSVTLGCGGSKPLSVGSRNTTEQTILGELVSQQIERKLGLTVKRQFSFTRTSHSHEAIAGGAVDISMDYTGSALTNNLRELAQATDPDTVREIVRAGYRSRFRIEAIGPLGFDARTVVLARQQDMAPLKYTALSQLHNDIERRWVLGISEDFLERQDGLRLLNRTYNLSVEGAPRTFAPELLGKALLAGEVRLLAAKDTDAVLKEPGVITLTDDRHAFPPQEAMILVRQEAIDQHPGLAEALKPLSGKISLEKMREMNHQVEFGKQTPADVVRQFLSTL